MDRVLRELESENAPQPASSLPVIMHGMAMEDDASITALPSPRRGASLDVLTGHDSENPSQPTRLASIAACDDTIDGRKVGVRSSQPEEGAAPRTSLDAEPTAVRFLTPVLISRSRVWFSHRWVLLLSVLVSKNSGWCIPRARWKHRYRVKTRRRKSSEPSS